MYTNIFMNLTKTNKKDLKFKQTDSQIIAKQQIFSEDSQQKICLKFIVFA